MAARPIDRASLLAMPVTEAPFRRNEKVISTEAIDHVPEGTKGKVMLVNGFSWVRYWVHFEDGTDIGSIDQTKLVRAKEWKDYLAERKARAEAPEVTEAVTDAADADAGGAGGATESATVNGVAVPGFLLERAKAARARLGG
jgi:hypothetical protein